MKKIPPYHNNFYVSATYGTEQPVIMYVSSDLTLTIERGTHITLGYGLRVSLNYTRCAVNAIMNRATENLSSFIL